MRFRDLDNGVRICPEIRLDSKLYTHNGIALYLASDDSAGHTLVHLLSASSASYEKIEAVVEFYRTELHLETRCGHYEEFIFFSEPFPLGEYMFEWLERRERVSLAEALKRVIELLKTLNIAHEKGLYNGRITPQSILLERTGSTLSLRMMGYGVAQALEESIRSDIDWFDYTFDLIGMSPAAVDIYGVAIILMGLVSGESGIDSFEATGLLPQSLRSGIIQQAMERALALRIDAYTDILSFSKDLEAALLEIDDRQGEVYVGDLVGFESAVKSVTSISEEHAVHENSGVWSDVFDTLQQDERSSLLCSLTSLTAIKPIDDEDEDVTRISSLPKQVLSMQRIKSVHAHDDSGKTSISARPKTDEPENTNRSKVDDIVNTGENEIIAKSDAADSHDVTGENDVEEDADITGEITPDLTDGAPAEEAPKLSTEERMASLKSLEDELDNDDDGDECPTRVMARPNYATISFGNALNAGQGVQSAIEEVIQTNREAIEKASSPVALMEKRIRAAMVVEATHDLKHDFYFEVEDPQPSVNPDPSQNPVNSPVTNAKNCARKVANTEPVQVQASASAMHFSAKQKKVIRVLILVVLILLIAVISVALFKLINR